MDFFEAAETRRSIRAYTGQPVADDIIEKIVRSGLVAPTSRNRRPCQFFVVRDPGRLSGLSKAKAAGAVMLGSCSAAVVVAADSGKADTWVEDSAVALSYMMLAATSLGVGSCWVQFHLRTTADGTDSEQAVRGILGIQEPLRIVGALSLGYPAQKLEPKLLSAADMDAVRFL